jgi:hypothetical protein
MWYQNSRRWQNAKPKSKRNWVNKAEAEELITYSSLRILRETLKNNPGTIEDAF